MKYFIAVILAVGILTSNAYGEWAGPVEVISSTWGSAEEQFGLKQGDTIAYDRFPSLIYTFVNNNIMIKDGVNGRMKIYGTNGEMKKIVNCIKGSTGEYNEECRFWHAGEYLQANKDGSLWTQDYSTRNFRKYSSTGTLISTSKTRPPELGQVTEKRIGKKEYQITVKFPDLSDPTKEKVWVIIATGSFPNYTQDKNGNLYGHGTKQVARFDDKGKEISRLTVPQNQYGEPIDLGQGVEPEIPIIAEYGSPVVAPNGNVYTWMRTPTHYKILKWTWQD